MFKILVHSANFLLIEVEISFQESLICYSMIIELKSMQLKVENILTVILISGPSLTPQYLNIIWYIILNFNSNILNSVN